MSRYNLFGGGRAEKYIDPEERVEERGRRSGMPIDQL